ncbi:glycosyltransferase family 2 protein [Buchananella felis]|uniref:glycosyltransferase family 2 protein n=1 Tax=Buchananella felis TaxID=3231492 RepID=UPI003529C8BD
MRVAAVVVTYNRRELLQKTLRALDAQTTPPEKIIVIDNASTDDTWQTLQGWESKTPLEAFRLAKNTGGAGGFYAGMEIAYEQGFEGFWIMDDDTVPRPPALEKLVESWQDAAAHQHPAPTFAASMVLWTDGEACRMNYPTAKWGWMAPLAHGKKWMNLDCTSFVSCLVTREAVEVCGLPYPEYFIWFDDAEYTYRLSKWSSGIFVPDSVVDHLMPSNDPVFWGMVTESNFWKFSKGARNQVSAGISLRRGDILANIFQSMISQMATSKAPIKLRLRLIWAMLSGLWFRPKVRYPRSIGHKVYDRGNLRRLGE